METANERIDLVGRTNAIRLILELSGRPNVLGRCPLSGEERMLSGCASMSVRDQADISDSDCDACHFPAITFFAILVVV